MKVIFLGTPAFAVPTLDRLARTRHEIMTVLTQPDRPAGRGMQPAPSPVKTRALELGLRLMQPDKASSPSALEEIRTMGPDAAVVVAYGQILKREFLDVPRFGCINLHPSLLPRYRGPTPIQSAILAGERVTGVTTMLLDEGTDTGDILLQREVVIADDDTAGFLHDKLAEVGAELMVETLEAVEKHSVTPRPQDEAEATMTRKLDKKDATVNWNRSAKEIFNLTRAMDPWPGCRTTFREDVLKVWKVEPCKEQPREGRPGEVLAAEGGSLIIRTGEGAVRILELQLPGGKRMTAAEFMRGHVIEAGTVLGG